MPSIRIGNLIGIGRTSGGSYWKTRNNVVGQKAVTPLTYSTNNGATTKTVGASGADYTSLITAYAAASAGDVIEIIDDSITLSARLPLLLGQDANGKAVKIKGKSTKTTVTMYNHSIPVYLAGTNTNLASIEFENLILTGPQGQITTIDTATHGFIHFINCVISNPGQVQVYNTKETVFDGVSFTDGTGLYPIYSRWNDNLQEGAKMICNNCTLNNIAMTNFIFQQDNSTGHLKKYDTLSVTNSNIKVRNDSYAFRGIYHYYRNFDVRGNTLWNRIYAGVEAGTAITGYYEAYAAGTGYVVGNTVWYNYNLWKCIINSTGNAPSKSSTYWEVARLTTGTIENNLIKRETYVADGHGIFVGLGCYDFSIKNNIVTNYWYNYVIKGQNNTIEYNCAGIGYKGFSVYVNDQYSVRNNTSRCAAESPFDFGPHDESNEGVINTPFKYNIFTSSVVDGELLYDWWIRYNPTPEFNNTFAGNIFFGDGVTARFQNATYALETEFAAFKSALADASAQFLNPEFTGEDPTIESYYKPNNLLFLKIHDDLKQAVGAVDYHKV